MKYICIIFIYVLLAFSNQEPQHSSSDPLEKEAVFSILSKKCNVCHRTKNPRRVFTLNNMDGLASKINKQVFVWKRMPKGNKIKLNIKEKEVLKNWINQLKK